MSGACPHEQAFPTNASSHLTSARRTHRVRRPCCFRRCRNGCSPCSGPAGRTEPGLFFGARPLLLSRSRFRTWDATWAVFIAVTKAHGAMTVPASLATIPWNAVICSPRRILTAVAVFFLALSLASTPASALNVFLEKMRGAQYMPCVSKPNCYKLVAANERVRVVYGYVEIDFAAGVVYAQDITTMRVVSFGFSPGSRGGAECMMKYAKFHIMEQYFEHDIQTDVTPRC